MKTLQMSAKLDGQISEFLHGVAQPYLPRSTLILLELSADFRLFFPAALAALYLSPSPVLFPLLSGLLLDLVAVGLIKLIFRRNRPHYNQGMKAAVSADHFSFPSGHSSRVFFVASLFPSYAFVWVWAAATSASRVLLGRHFAADVLVGALLGVLEGIFAFRYLTPQVLSRFVNLLYSYGDA